MGSLPQPRLHPNHENVRETPAQGRPANTPQGHREQGWAEDLQDREEPKGRGSQTGRGILGGIEDRYRTQVNTREP